MTIYNTLCALFAIMHIAIGIYYAYFLLRFERRTRSTESVVGMVASSFVYIIIGLAYIADVVSVHQPIVIARCGIDVIAGILIYFFARDIFGKAIPLCCIAISVVIAIMENFRLF